MNYPNGIKKKCNVQNITYQNRGMTLENDLNTTNKFYIDNNIAYIYKKPTPIKVVKVKYNEFGKPIIKEAYYNEPSTTDYNGIYKGKYIDYEAKETKNKNCFPLINIHPHQITHLNNVLNAGGISFLIIRFTTLNKTYLLKTSDLINYIDNCKRKSIELKYIEEKGYLIKDKLLKRVDYLEIVDQMEVL